MKEIKREAIRNENEVGQRKIQKKESEDYTLKIKKK